MFVFHPSPDGPCRAELAGRAGQRVIALFLDAVGHVCVRFPDGEELYVFPEELTTAPAKAGDQ